MCMAELFKSSAFLLLIASYFVFLPHNINY